MGGSGVEIAAHEGNQELTTIYKYKVYAWNSISGVKILDNRLALN